MSKKNVIVKADDYKYPSLEERKEVLKNYPELTFFGFENKSVLEALINDRLSLDDAFKNDNLYWWDNCLLNRFGILKETYIYAITNYIRGFVDDYTKCSQNEIINRLQFDYYAEIFYYYFFSTRDIIAQILCLYLKINIKEIQLHFNEGFIRKINDSKINDLTMTFYKATKDASDFRNGFAHRFTPTLYDNRTTISELNGKKSLNFGNGCLIESKKIVENIDNSLKSLSDLMNNLKMLMNSNGL